MEEVKNFINIYWIISHQISENITSYITDENKQKNEIIPIYSSNDIKKNYVLSIFMYVSEKKNKELFFTSEFVNDKTIKYSQKITLENEKYENLFLYDLIINEGISCEIQFELFLKMINDKYKINNERIKEDLFNNTKKLIMRKKDYFDFYLYISLFVESYTNKDFISKLLFVLLALIQKKIEITDITPERLEKLKDNFNNFKKNPKFIQIMFQEKEEKYQNIILELTYKVIFLFNYKLQANNNYHLEMLKMKENIAKSS